MNYCITRLVHGCNIRVDISEEDFRDIKESKKYLLECLLLEEELDAVMESYLEYEMSMLLSTSKQMLFHNHGYGWFRIEINAIARRIFNLLSSGRLYLDHCVHHLKNIYGHSDVIDAIKDKITREYDSRLGYRVMEALRNHVQHRGFPAHAWTYGSKRVDNEEKHHLSFTVVLHLEVEKLREDGKFKKAVLEELASIDEKIDIGPLIREYVASIGSIHEEIRSILREDIKRWEKVLVSCDDRYKEKAGSEGESAGLAAVSEDDNGSRRDKVSIFFDFIKHRQELMKKNRKLDSLAIRYVTLAP
jgi:hypothetical protein